MPRCHSRQQRDLPIKLLYFRANPQKLANKSKYIIRITMIHTHMHSYTHSVSLKKLAIMYLCTISPYIFLYSYINSYTHVTIITLQYHVCKGTSQYKTLLHWVFPQNLTRLAFPNKNLHMKSITALICTRNKEAQDKMML